MRRRQPNPQTRPPRVESASWVRPLSRPRGRLRFPDTTVKLLRVLVLHAETFISCPAPDLRLRIGLPRARPCADRVCHRSRRANLQTHQQCCCRHRSMAKTVSYTYCDDVTSRDSTTTALAFHLAILVGRATQAGVRSRFVPHLHNRVHPRPVRVSWSLLDFSRTPRPC